MQKKVPKIIDESGLKVTSAITLKEAAEKVQKRFKRQFIIVIL